MKTGGTLNFLKRAGAIFMLLAIFASSCNKYADDFDQINTKLDALATSVAGVAQLTTDMAALKSQVAALTTAVASLPTKAQTDASFASLALSLTGITGKIDAITATLATVASTGTATKAVVDQLKLDLATLADKVATDNAAMALQLAGLASDNVTMKANLQAIIDANTALALQITAVQDQITALVGDGGTDATALTIKGLQLMLDAQKVILDQLLANSNMYNGNVNITSDAEVTFWLPKISVWKDGGMINGTFNVDATSITNLTGLKAITDNILAVIGGPASWTHITTTAGNALTFAKLASTTGDVIVTTAAAAGEVSFPALVSVGQNYSVTGYDIDDAVLATVTGNVTLDYDGGYNQPALASAANVYLNDYMTNATAGNLADGTLSVDFSGLTTVGSLETLATVAGLRGQTAVVGNAANSLALSSATTITTGAGAKTIAVVAPAALTIVLNYAGTSSTPLTSLTVTAAAATSVTAKVVKVTGALAITAKTTGSSVSLPGLTAVGGTTNIQGVTLSAPVVATLTGAVNLVKTTPVSLPALTSAPAGLTAADAVTFSAPVYAVTPAAGLTVGNAVTTSVEVASTTGSATSLNSVGALETLTVNALTEALVVPASVETLTVTGKTIADLISFTAATQSVSATSNSLVTATLGGHIKTATVQSTGLTALHTSGVVNSLTVNGCTNTALTSLDLQHVHFPSGPGSVLIITGNTKLTSLTTSTNYAKTITITGNTSLAALNLASYVNPLTVGGAAYTISGNALTGGYVASVASAGTDPFVEAVIPSNVLLPLKSLVAYAATNLLAHTVALDLDDASTATGAQTLASLMQANAAQAVLDNAAVAGSNPTVVNAVAAINTDAEMALVVAQ